MINIKPTFMFKIIMKVGFLKTPNDFKYKFIWGEVCDRVLLLYNINFDSEFNNVNNLS